MTTHIDIECDDLNISNDIKDQYNQIVDSPLKSNPNRSSTTMPGNQVFRVGMGQLRTHFATSRSLLRNDRQADTLIPT